LLPNKLSQLGSGIAWGDVNGDARPDCFVGGAAGQTGVLRIQGTDQTFRAHREGPWKNDADCEDMGTLSFDVDSDGDQDLYVVSGGVEWEADDQRLSDRLYINVGDGTFQRAADSVLPETRESGSCVVACDFDRDLDLFVGSRVIPGRWPLAPRSCLLRNNGGRLVDVTQQVAPELKKVGLVTGAVWSDTNNDGWNDLLLTLEWGPITVFQNDSGRLTNATGELGLAGDTGWWNGIATADFDHDGDVDYIVTNFGLNTEYHATREHPAQLYVRDFDENGQLDLVEAEWEEQICYPIRGRSCSSQAMPFINEKFTTFHDFALAGLEDIYSSSALAEAQQFQVTRLETVVSINQGTDPWEVHNLPRLAQASPAFGVLASDLDADGNVDLYLVQNFMETQPETGQMDGGVSMMLRGDGQGNFAPMRPADSGLIVTGQGMGLTSVDLNQDAWPNLVLTQNNASAMAYLNNPIPNRKARSVRLRDQPGNVTGVGSKVTLRTKAGKTLSGEVYGGSGYLSQSSGELSFGISADDEVERVEIRWPDGTSRTFRPPPKTARYLFTRSMPAG
jgi:hypothetical protein